ncbi:hypothetical protein Bca52824_078484 [Brassica carinata]|uniref:DNA (cytosine-5)-methyltransferase n=1 Tax=Brassica carinata TaxID=52824 RepID=A0A8X7PWU7_BRACI|nr:hypothetical protein Bca52824_078484 [Brassica carinata]
MVSNGTKAGEQKKRPLPEIKVDGEDDVSTRNSRPRRAAACTNFKEKSVRISEKSATVETKQHQTVEDEVVALHFTSSPQSGDEPRQTRRLTDFILHDAYGVPQPVAMVEIGDIFVTGVILPSGECADKEKAKGVKCDGFGRVENWSISGYDDGYPVVWFSTELADYDCGKPATSYKKMYDYFYQKAFASVEVYKKVAKSAGGDSDISLDELLVAVSRSMSLESKCFSTDFLVIRNFLIRQGEFIYNQLAGLDETAKKDEASFAEIPVLVALRDENSRLDNGAVLMEGRPSNGVLRIDGVSEAAKCEALTSDQEMVDEDQRYAKIMQDEEDRKTMQRPRRNNGAASASNKGYVKTTEDEIAGDYPLPAYYKNFKDEADELIVADDYEVNYEDLPRRMLHNWALYNSDSRFISLELLPMKPCADIDVTVFGSGLMAEDGGFWFGLDDPDTSTSGQPKKDLEGMPVFLSQIKEWMIEWGCSTISISIRTDVAWYRLGKPSKQYAPWFEPVLKTARVTIGIFGLLEEQTRMSKLSFEDVTKRVSEFQKNHKAYISSDRLAVNRYLVGHGQIILQMCSFVSDLARKRAERHNTRWTIKKKKILFKVNCNPRAGMAPVVSKRKAMQATTTRLINRIWGEFYSNYSPEEPVQAVGAENEEEEVEEEGEIEEDDAEETVPEPVEEVEKSHTPLKKIRGVSGKTESSWSGETLGKTSAVAVGGAVVLEVDGIEVIYFVEYMFEKSNNCKMLHGRLYKEDVTLEKTEIKLNASKTGFSSNGVDYSVDDYVYVKPEDIDGSKEANGRFKSGRNIGLRPFVVCQILEIIVRKESRKASFEVKVRRLYRPEDVSDEKAYASDIQELYYSEDTDVLQPEALEGKCEVRKKIDMPSRREYPISENIFFCEQIYNPSKGSLKQLSVNIKPKYTTVKDDALLRKRKGKGLVTETDSVTDKPEEVSKETRLATLDIFAGCGGLSQGLEQAGVSATKWAIEYEEPAGKAFRKNHPETTVFVDNCNVILRAIMEKCGDQDECISTKEANELAEKLDEDQKRTLPLPGQVDFINGGPPCQGFSGMNRFNQSSWSKVQCEMILAFLSFADYFRPRYFLLENVRTFVSFNKGQTFQLTLASLLEMGYQVRFGILEAGAYGVSQSRKRAFIWAAAPDELKISLSKGVHYAAVRSTQYGAPFRPITVKDTIGDLPSVDNGESKTKREYKVQPISWFQKEIRGDNIVLTDHICKEMNELNLIRCKKIPKRPGADWRDLPEEKVTLSKGQVVDLIPWCLPNTAKRHNQWKGLFGRLDWEGNFPTSITDPQPMGKVGMCFHPDQDRIITVRECARSQGFPDSYEFQGNIIHKHRQIGNAVPPPLAFALGRKLKEAVQLKVPKTN